MLKTATRNRLMQAVQDNAAQLLREVLEEVEKSGDLQEALTSIYKPRTGASLLGLAVHHRSLDACKVLIEKGADPNAAFLNPGRSALYGLCGDYMCQVLGLTNFEVDEAFYDLFIPLINADADHGRPDPFVRALQEGKLLRAKKLLIAGFEVDKRYHLFNNLLNPSIKLLGTAFLVYMKLSDYKTAQFLLDNHADVNATVEQTHDTALYDAVISDRIEAVRFLIRQGADLNKTSVNGYTPLTAAIEKNNIPIFDLLMDAGADPKCPTATGVTPILEACSAGHTLIVEKLLREKIQLNPKRKTLAEHTPLTAAIYYAREKVANMLIEQGADCNVLLSLPGHALHTPITLAVEQNNVALFRLLLKKGAEVNPCTLEGLPISGPIVYALARAKTHIEIISELLTAKNINLDSVCFQFPALYGRVDVIDVLSKHFEDTGRKADLGDLQKTILNGIKINNEYIVKLFSPKIDVNFYNHEAKTTPLLYAITLGHTNLVYILLTSGANPNYVGPNTQSKTPLQLAVSNKNRLFTLYLLQHGADINPVLISSVITDIEFLLDILQTVFGEAKPDKKTQMNWLEDLIKYMYFDKQVPDKILKKCPFDKLGFTNIEVIDAYLIQICRFYDLDRMVRNENSYTLQGDRAFLDALAKKILGHLPKDKKNVLFSLKVKGNQLVLSITTKGELPFLKILMKGELNKIKFTPKVTHSPAIHINNTSVSTAAPPKQLRPIEIDFITNKITKIAAGATLSLTPKEVAEPIHADLIIVVDFSNQFALEQQHYLLVKQKVQATLSLTNMEELASRLNKVAKESKFDSTTHLLTLTFDAKSSLESSEWEAAVFTWFNDLFIQTASKESVVPQATASPGGVVIEQQASDLEEINTAEDLRVFLVKLLPESTPRFTMGWIEAFAFDKQKNKTNKARLHYEINLKSCNSVNINGCVVVPYQFLKVIDSTINDPTLFSLRHDENKAPFLVIDGKFMAQVEKVDCYNAVKKRLEEWLIEQRTVLVEKTRHEGDQRFFPSQGLAPVRLSSKAWLLPALLDTKHANPGSFNKILSQLNLIFNKMKEINEAEKKIYNRAYCLYIFCLVNNLFHNDSKNPRVERLRHVLRHAAFSQDFSKIVKATCYLAEHSEEILDLSTTDAKFDLETLKSYNQAEQYLSDLAQMPLSNEVDYEYRFKSEKLYLFGLVANEKIENKGVYCAAIAFTACLLYKCIKELNQFDILDREIVDYLKRISIFVGHDYLNAIQPDEHLSLLCDGLATAIKSRTDFSLGSQCLQWLTTETTEKLEPQNTGNKIN